MTRKIFDCIIQDGVLFVPIVHGRVEFALEIRRQLEAFKPDVVAVEFPPVLYKVIEKAVKRLPFLSVVLYEDSQGVIVYIPIEPHDGMIEAIRFAMERQIPRAYVDFFIEGYKENFEAVPDPYAIRTMGYRAYCEAYEKVYKNDEPSDQDKVRETTMTYHIQDLRKRHERVALVCGIAHYSRIRNQLAVPQARPIERLSRPGIVLANLSETSSREVLSEMPYISVTYEGLRREPIESADLDRLKIHRELFQKARDKHLENSKEKITPLQATTFYQFARNLSLVAGRLTPGFYELVIAARGCANDNFAYELWELGCTYPWQDHTGLLPQIDLKGEDLFLNGYKIRFRRRFPKQRRRLVRMPVKQRPRERKPGEWKKLWTGYSICSHPPEDIVIEGYGNYLRKKAISILSEEQASIEPFMTSILDGIDMRETIRHWFDRKIYVKNNRPIRGKVGSVVMVFDEDSEKGEEYPWLMTWLGEHEQESDMAFYSTPAGDQVVGPGISKCIYGGFVMTYPPGRLVDIWSDPYFDHARSKSERLLLSGIDYSLERLVVYVAAKPPLSRCKSVAEKEGKKIVYIPIGHLSPVSIKRIRTFHVLDGHHVRLWAKDYVF